MTEVSVDVGMEVVGLRLCHDSRAGLAAPVRPTAVAATARTIAELRDAEEKRRRTALSLEGAWAVCNRKGLSGAISRGLRGTISNGRGLGGAISKWKGPGRCYKQMEGAWAAL